MNRRQEIYALLDQLQESIERLEKDGTVEEGLSAFWGKNRWEKEAEKTKEVVAREKNPELWRRADALKSRTASFERDVKKMSGSAVGNKRRGERGERDIRKSVKKELAALEKATEKAQKKALKALDKFHAARNKAEKKPTRRNKEAMKKAEAQFRLSHAETKIPHRKYRAVAKAEARRLQRKNRPGPATPREKSNLVARLSKQRGVRDPEALAAWIGRRVGGLE